MLENAASIFLSRWVNEQAVPYAVHECLSDILTSINVDYPSYEHERRNGESIPGLDFENEFVTESKCFVRQISRELVDELIENVIQLHDRSDPISRSSDEESGNSDSLFESEISINWLFLERSNDENEHSLAEKERCKENEIKPTGWNETGSSDKISKIGTKSLAKILKNDMDSQKLKLQDIDLTVRKNALWASKLTRGVKFDNFGRILQVDNIIRQRQRTDRIPKVTWSVKSKGKESKVSR
ncbi:hypothetical protein Aperf_G00000068251 [Anoplocephala perfoliata]